MISLSDVCSPFRDRPVRVGGGFAYMNNDVEPEYMAAMKRIKEEQDDQMAAMLKGKTGSSTGNKTKNISCSVLLFGYILT